MSDIGKWPAGAGGDTTKRVRLDESAKKTKAKFNYTFDAKNQTTAQFSQQDVNNAIAENVRRVWNS